MTTILLRTFFMYGIIVVSMKLMGKRQLGQMQVSEFVTAIILSELAALPISDKNTPLLHCLVPLILIIALEVIMSFISLKSARAQHFLESLPVVLIDKGVVDQKALTDARITLSELLVELRIAGLSSLRDAYYVFLEPNGKFSVIPRSCARQVTCSDLSIGASEDEPDITIITDGMIIYKNLNYLSKDEKWVKNSVKPHKISDVLLFAATASGEKTVIPKEKK